MWLLRKLLPSSRDSAAWLLYSLMGAAALLLVGFNLYMLRTRGLGFRAEQLRKRKALEAAKKKATAHILQGGSVGGASSSSSGAAAPQAASSVVRVAPTSDGRGRGVFAERSVALGSCVLRESPLLACDTRPRAALQSSFDTLGAHEQDRVWTFGDSFACAAQAESGSAHADGTRTLSGIMRSNALPLGPPLPDDGDELDSAGHPVPPLGRSARVALFATLSRLNHSCAPNVEVQWDAATGTGGAFVVARVASGDELTRSYLPDAPALDWEQRRARLQADFGFVCRCALCVQQGRPADSGAERNEARIRSDSNRRRIASLRALLSSLGDDAARVLQTTERLLQLLEAEGCAGGSYAADVLRLSADLLASSSAAATHADRAEELATRAAELLTRAQGAASPAVKACLDLMDRARQAQHDEASEQEHTQPEQQASELRRRQQA